MFSSIMRILQITSLEQPPLYSYIPLSRMDNFNELPGVDLCFSLQICMEEPVPHPLLKNIPLLLVVKNRPSDNQISSYDFLKMHKSGIQPGLQITFPKKYPSLLVQFQTPFDNLKKLFSLKVHIQL